MNFIKCNNVCNYTCMCGSKIKYLSRSIGFIYICEEFVVLCTDALLSTPLQRAIFTHFRLHPIVHTYSYIYHAYFVDIARVKKLILTYLHSCSNLAKV